MGFPYSYFLQGEKTISTSDCVLGVGLGLFSPLPPIFEKYYSFWKGLGVSCLDFGGLFGDFLAGGGSVGFFYCNFPFLR